MTILLDVTSIEAEAKKEINEEARKVAVSKLKELYSRQEKAKLVLRNIEREIASYLSDIQEQVVYDSAGIDTTKE